MIYVRSFSGTAVAFNTWLTQCNWWNEGFILQCQHKLLQLSTRVCGNSTLLRTSAKHPPLIIERFRVQLMEVLTAVYRGYSVNI